MFDTFFSWRRFYSPSFPLFLHTCSFLLPFIDRLCDADLIYFSKICFIYFANNISVIIISEISFIYVTCHNFFIFFNSVLFLDLFWTFWNDNFPLH